MRSNVLCEQDQLDSFIQRPGIRTGVKHSRDHFACRAISTGTNRLDLPMASASRRSIGAAAGEAMHSVGIHNVVALGEFPARLSQRVRKDNRSTLARAPMLPPQVCSTRKIRPRKKIWRETEAIGHAAIGTGGPRFWKFLYEQAGGNIADANQLARKWSAVREQATLWCRSRPKSIPAQTRAPLRRIINLLMRAIPLAPVSFRRACSPNESAHSDFPGGGLSALRNLSSC